jgi:hypothetical protein
MMWKSVAGPALRIGSGAVLAVFLATSLAHGQAAAPAAAPASTNPSILGKDGRGFTYLVPYVDTSKPAIEVAQMKQREANAKGRIRTFLQEGIGGDKATFDFYFHRIFFPYLAPSSDLIEAGKADIATERVRLVRDYLEIMATNPQSHAYLATMTLDKMKEFLAGNYHPAVRYNAMLTISLLNDVEPARLGANRSVPEPMLTALPFIYEQFTKPENNDAIRVAALLGLVRHLEWDNFRGPVGSPTPAIAAPLRTQIVKTLLDLASQTAPPEGRDSAGHEWMRRRAIEGLTHAGYHQATPELIGVMETLVKNDKEPLAIRTAAATAMGIMAYPAAAKLELTPTAKELGFLALVACDQELTRIMDLKTLEEDQKKRLSNPAGGGSAMGGYGGDSYSDPSGYGGSGAEGYGSSGAEGYGYDPYGSGGSGGMMMPGGGAGGLTPPKPPDPKQYRFDYIRRKIRAQLYAIEIALGGPEVNLRPTSTLPGQEAPAATGPMRGIEAVAAGKPDLEYINSVKKGVTELVRVVETTTTDFEDLEKDLRKKMKPLEAITRKLGEAPAVAPASDLPDVPTVPDSVPATEAPAAATPPAPVAPPAAVSAGPPG